MTPPGSARQTLISEAGVNELSVSAGGTTTSVLTAGLGKPLLLLHGLTPAGGLVWWPVFRALSRMYKVVAPDLPGLGESQALRGRLTAARIVEWLGEVIEECCDESVTLVATSLAGGFGLRLAAAQPGRVRNLILTDAQGLALFRPPPGFLVATTHSRLRPTSASVKHLVRYVIHDQEQVRRLHAPLWDAFLGYMISQAGRREVRRAMGGFATRANARPIPETTLQGLEPPVGLIWGRHDRPFPISIAEDVNARFGWPLEVIEDAGHLPYIEHPSKFTDAIEALASPA